MPEPSSPAGTPRHVFVYGTLRRGGTNDITRLQPAPRWVGFAQVPGVLFHLGAYPGMTLGGDQPVHGEVYAIEPALEVILDAIEGLSGDSPTDEYLKRETMVQLKGQPLPCLVYEINTRYTASARRIEHGDWLHAVGAAAP
ncbi:gamma-glutamylcyclotransferase family protein [Acidovorax sp.]|uniref:gamma-glutamylcyclotransferase family protein n=1 Tax=Acidovorax sp. TaxID=1872122 RepID=UPI0025C3AF41|nr:gamma-glutamylcyclotransferase family protein [Acidovorax sp.]MBL7089965.1 gamma-glutamylcyclotransferase [Acidovorax sp.]